MAGKSRSRSLKLHKPDLPAFKLRCGSAEDIEAVYRLNKAVFSEAWSSQSLLSALESGYDLILCEADGELVAFVLSLTVCDDIQIMQIAVAEHYRRKGLASLMTDALEKQASVDISSITLEVRLSNIAARGLYAKLGFEEVGYRKHYYAPDISGNREDAVLMTKNL